MTGRLARLAFAPLVGAILCASAPVHSAEASPGQDEVTLKNGDEVRGTIVAVQSGVRVKIIERGHTRARTIPWARVRNVTRGKPAPAATETEAAPSPPPEPAPAPASPPPSADAAPPANPVRLHVDSPKPALVYAHETTSGAATKEGSGFDRATPVCFAPCDKVFDGASDQTFTASGDFNASSPFTLAGRQGDMELSVRPGRHQVRTAGLVLTVGGGVLTVVGATLAIVGAVLGSATVNVTVNGAPATSTKDPSNGWLVPTGAGIAAGGVAVLIGGIVALVESKTSLDLHPRANAGEKTEAKARYWMGEF